MRNTSEIISQLQAIPFFSCSDLIIDQAILLSDQLHRNWWVRTKQGEEWVVRWVAPGYCKQRLRNEIHNMSRLASQGLAVDYLYYDIDQGITVRPYLVGKIVSTLSIDNYFISQVSAKLKQLHTSGIQLVNTVNVYAEIGNYQRAIHSQQPAALVPYQPLFAWLEKKKSIFLQGRLVPCHHDLNLDNFLVTPTGKLHLLDWEYAGNGYAWFDLATFSIEARLDREQEYLFLQEYGGNALQAQVALYKPVVCLLASLWYCWQQLCCHSKAKIFFGKQAHIKRKQGLAYIQT